MLHHPGQPVGSVWLLDGFAFSKNGITGLVHFHGFQMLLNLFLFNIFYLGLGPNVFFGNRVLVRGHYELRPTKLSEHELSSCQEFVQMRSANPMTSFLVLPLFYPPSKLGRDELSKLLIHSFMVGLPAFLALLTEIEVSENLRKWELRKHEQSGSKYHSWDLRLRDIGEQSRSYLSQKIKKFDSFLSKLKLYCFKFISHLENTSLLQISCCVIPEAASQP